MSIRESRKIDIEDINIRAAKAFGIVMIALLLAIIALNVIK